MRRATPQARLRALRGVIGVLIGVMVFGAVCVGADAKRAAHAQRTERHSGGRQLVLRGHRANNTFVIRASGSDRGTYSIDGGRPVRFAGIRSLTMDGVGGHDVCRIVNPRRGLLAPPGGISCNGGNRPGRPRRGVLQVVGGKASSGRYSPSGPGSGTLTHRLRRTVQVIRFTGMAPTIDTTPAATLVITASTTAGDTVDLVDGPTATELTVQSEHGYFESYTFANKTSVTISADTAANDQVLLNNSHSASGLAALSVHATSTFTVQQSALSGATVDLMTTGGNMVLSGALSSGAATTKLTASGSISESGAGTIDTTSTLTTSSSGGTTLNGANTVGAFNGTNTTSGNVALMNTAATLTVTGVSETGGGSLTLKNTGAMTLTGTVSAGGGGAINLEPSGALSESGSGLVSTTGTLTTTSSGGTTLNGANTVGAFNGTNTTSGNVALTNTAATLTVTGVSETGGGSVTLKNTGAIALTGPVNSSASLLLQSTGGFGATGSGSVSATSLDLVDAGSTPLTWTISPGKVETGGSGNIPYTGITSLAVTGGSGGDTFDVTASPSVPYSLDGGVPSSGPGATLNYDAQGRTVSGSLSPPTGEIDSPTVKPVSFTRMNAVNILNRHRLLNVAVKGSGTVTGPGGINCPDSCSQSYGEGTVVTLTAAPRRGSSFVGWSGACSGSGACRVTMSSDRAVTAAFAAARPKPSCSLTPMGARVFAAPMVDVAKKKHRKPRVLKLRARCDQAARVVLSGKVTARTSNNAGNSARSNMRTYGPRSKVTTYAARSKVRTFKIAPKSVSIAASESLTITVKLPRGALAALKKGAHESVALSLTATNANGSAHAAASIQRLRLAKRT